MFSEYCFRIFFSITDCFLFVSLGPSKSRIFLLFQKFRDRRKQKRKRQHGHRSTTRRTMWCSVRQRWTRWRTSHWRWITRSTDTWVIRRPPRRPPRSASARNDRSTPARALILTRDGSSSWYRPCCGF